MPLGAPGSSSPPPSSPPVVPKRTRIVDAYGRFGGEHEALLPGVGEDLDSLESWRTTTTSLNTNTNRLYNPQLGNPHEPTTTTTSIRYRTHGVPEYSVRSFFRHLNFAVPSRWDVVEITADGGAQAMLSYRHIGETLRDFVLPPTGPGLRRVQFTRPARRRFFLFLTEPDTSVASSGQENGRKSLVS